MAQRLRVDEILTVGFVDKGDNPPAEIVFYKRKDDVSKRIVRRDGKFLVMDKDGKKVLGTHSSMAAAKRQLAAIDKGSDMNVLQKFLKAVGLKAGLDESEVEELLADGADGGSTPDGGPSNQEEGQMTFDVNKLDEEQKAAFDKAVADAVAAKIAEAAETEEDELPEPVAKAIDGLKDQIEKAESRAEKAEQQVSDMVEQREVQKAIQKAQKLGLPGTNPDDFAPMLRKALDSLDEEEAEKFEQILQSAGNAIRSGMLGEIGRPGEGATEVDAEVANLAKSYREQKPELSEQEARAMVWRDHPELYEKHRRERPARTSEEG